MQPLLRHHTSSRLQKTPPPHPSSSPHTQVKISEYAQVKSQLSALARKQGGNLAVRDLSDYARRITAVDTENLVTVFVAVPKSSTKEFLGLYETLTDFVVPRSAAPVDEDAEYALYSLVLFRRVVDTFKSTARAKGFIVREAVSAAEGTSGVAAAGGQGGAAALAKVQAEAEAKRSQLEQYCLNSYGEAFSGWIHVCAVRLFVESILRYGLPPRFLAVLSKPNPKQTTKLRKLLATSFGSGGGYYDDVGGTGVGEEMYPYVSFSINMD